ncbi:enolase C-terminal domain-like protein [Candidatus Latescibacterota bacterium]
MNRREFFKKAGIAFGTTPFWAGILPEYLAASIPSGVKITDVKTFIVEHLVFVKIYTNAGVTGLGEASITNGGLERAVEGAILDRSHILIGRNPTDIEFLWQALFRWPRTRGGTLDVSAISGMDIALWDILGKLLEAPVYQLLGGKARNRSRLYAHCNSAKTPEQMREMVPPLLDEGFKVIRIGPNWGNFNVFERPHNLKEAVALTESLRETIGDNIDIIVDAHGYLTTNMALEYAKAVEPYRLLFLEDPVVQENMSGLQYIQEHTTTPLHIGESNSSKFGFFKDIIFRRLASGVRPDVVHAGGLTESKKICAMAEANFMDVSLHAGYSSVASFAATHLSISTPSVIVQELASRRKTGSSDWLLDLFNGDDISIVDGYAQLPEKPGIGCDLNEKVAKEHPHVGGRSQPHTVYEDGSVSDW